jgi:hypothetical protein
VVFNTVFAWLVGPIWFRILLQRQQATCECRIGFTCPTINTTVGRCEQRRHFISYLKRKNNSDSIMRHLCDDLPLLADFQTLRTRSEFTLVQYWIRKRLSLRRFITSRWLSILRESLRIDSIYAECQSAYFFLYCLERQISSLAQNWLIKPTRFCREIFWVDSIRSNNI